MTSGKKVALIVGIVAVVGIGTYLGVKAYKKKRRTSGNAQKNNRKINIV